MFSNEPLALVDQSMIDTLIGFAAANPRQRCRICFHPEPTAKFHDMLIVHGRDAFVPAHRHSHRSESLHVVDGAARLVVFSDDGDVTGAAHMSRADVFHYHMPPATYHTLLIESDWFVFQEGTTGPFDPDDSDDAAWNPITSDKNATRAAQANWVKESEPFIQTNPKPRIRSLK